MRCQYVEGAVKGESVGNHFSKWPTIESAIRLPPYTLKNHIYRNYQEPFKELSKNQSQNIFKWHTYHIFNIYSIYLVWWKFVETKLEKLDTLGMYGVSHKQVHMLLFMGLKPLGRLRHFNQQLPSPKNSFNMPDILN